MTYLRQGAIVMAYNDADTQTRPIGEVRLIRKQMETERQERWLVSDVRENTKFSVWIKR